MDKRAKELLNWATSQSAATPQSSQTDPPVRPSKTLDPSIIDAILGPDDSTLMVDSMRAITDTSLDLDDRLTAFDNLELLVEQIDNASNLDILKLWPPLLATLSSPEPQLRRYAAWVTGTAVQNNPKAQGHLFQYQGIKKLISRLDDEYSVRTKVLYALGSELNHFPAGTRQFTENGGWNKYRKCCDDTEEGTECLRRVAFFISNFLAEEGHNRDLEEIQRNGFFARFVQVLGEERYLGEGDLLEKVLQAVGMMVKRGVGKEDRESCERMKGLLAGLRERFPEALEESQWEELAGSL